MDTTEREQRIARLVRTMRDAERELRSLRGSIPEPGQAVSQLRDAWTEYRASVVAQGQPDAIRASILDGLASSVVLLDSTGVILTVNEAWRRFGEANGLRMPDFAVGANYLESCDRAEGADSEEAHAAGTGIRQVLRAERDRFVLEYPCHSPEEQRWFRLLVTSWRGGAQRGGVVMHLDITEARLAEAQLHDSERRYRELFEENPAADLLCDGDGRFVAVNPAFRRMFGVQDDAPLDGLRLQELFPSAEAWTEFREQLRRDGQLTPWEGALRNRFGSSLRVLGTFVASRTDDGEMREVRGYLFDDTRRSIAEVALRTTAREQEELARQLSTERQRLVEAQAVASVGSWQTDLETLDVTWSDETYRIFGVSPETFRPTHAAFLELVHPDDRDAVDRAFHASVGTAERWVIQHRVLLPGGREKYIEERWRTHLDAQGRSTRAVGTCRDITELVLAQTELSEAEARFRALFEQAAVGICHVAPDGRFLRVNRRFSEILGYPPAELLTLTCTAATHPDDREFESGMIQRLRAGEFTTRAWDKRYLRADGTAVWCTLSLSLLEIPGRTEPDFVGVVTDITERIRAESELRRAAEHMAGIVQIQYDLHSGSHSAAALTELMTHRAQALAGATSTAVALVERDELVCRAYVGPDPDAVGTRSRLGDTLAGQAVERGLVIHSADCELDSRVSPDAYRRFGIRSLLIAPVREAGVVTGVLILGSGRPNTFTDRDEHTIQILADTLGGALERHHASQRVVASEAQYRLLFHNNPHPMWTYDLATLRFLAVNAAAITHYGYSEAEFLAMTIRDIRPEAELDRLGRTVLTLSEIGKRGGQLRHRKRDGTLIDVEISSDAVTFDGRPARLVLAHDITEQLRAEAAQRNSEQEFHVLAEGLPQIVWTTRPDGWTLYLSQNWMEYTGLTLEESLGDGWNKPFHPDDRQRAWDAWQHATATVSDYELECRLRRRDDTYRWWLIRGQPLRDASGTVLKWFGTFTDIHDIKLAELESARINRALHMLHGAHEAFLRAEREADLTSGACRVAVESGGFDLAWVGYKDQDRLRPMTPVGRAGAEPGDPGEFDASWPQDGDQGEGPAALAVRIGQPVVASDIAQDRRFLPWLPSAQRRGYRSAACLPLIEPKGSFGVLVLLSRETNPGSDQELRILQSLADDLASAIGRWRARDEQERMQAAVLKVAAGVSASTGDELFEQLALKMVDALGAQAGFVACLLPGSPTRARTIVSVVDGKVAENFEYVVRETPCGLLLDAEECIAPETWFVRFSGSSDPTEFQARTCVGRRLSTTLSGVVGQLCVMFNDPLTQTDFVSSTLRIFASRAAAELERQTADAQVREQAELLDHAREAILVKDLDHKILYWNRGAERMYGWSAHEAIGRNTADLFSREDLRFREEHIALLAHGEWQGELSQRTRDGRSITAEVRWTLVRDEQGQPRSVLSIASDITQKKQLETQFLRAQRLESIGTLAGGIAHDLNNVLTPILMSMELLKHKLVDDTSLELVQTAHVSAQRGADLVRQVLSFAQGVEARQLTVNPVPLARDVQAVVRDTFPKSIEFQLTIADGLWTVQGDPTQLHQVLLNLCVNARDAMPTGGHLTISLRNTVLDEVDTALHPHATPGSYVLIEVADTGTGIPEDIRDRIFDPFFTTKELGKGTGLGLSTSLGIVKTHGGFISLDSEVGKGTTFKVFLPGGIQASGIESHPAGPGRLLRGKNELVLVVDDEEPIRRIVHSTLTRHGYRVLLAGHGAEAVSLFTLYHREIAVVLTDMAMPVMDGPTLVGVLREMKPGVRVIFSSGLGGVVPGEDKSGNTPRFLAKPYSAEALLRALHEALRPIEGAKRA